jgi:hypothetical protein
MSSYVRDPFAGLGSRAQLSRATDGAPTLSAGSFTPDMYNDVRRSFRSYVLSLKGSTAAGKFASFVAPLIQDIKFKNKWEADESRFDKMTWDEFWSYVFNLLQPALWRPLLRSMINAQKSAPISRPLAEVIARVSMWNRWLAIGSGSLHAKLQDFTAVVRGLADDELAHLIDVDEKAAQFYQDMVDDDYSLGTFEIWTARLESIDVKRNEDTIKWNRSPPVLEMLAVRKRT